MLWNKRWEGIEEKIIFSDIFYIQTGCRMKSFIYVDGKKLKTPKCTVKCQ